MTELDSVFIDFRKRILNKLILRKINTLRLPSGIIYTSLNLSYYNHGGE